MFKKAITAEPEKTAAQELQFAPGLLTELCNLTLAQQTSSKKDSALGFVLFGRFSGMRVVVEAVRSVPAGHLFHSRSSESLADEEQLGIVIASAETDVSLAEMDAVGLAWSRQKGDLPLTDAELSLLDWFFREPGKIGLKLKPVDSLQVSAGLFVRSATGEMNPEQPTTVLQLQRGEGLTKQLGGDTTAVENSQKASHPPLRNLVGSSSETTALTAPDQSNFPLLLGIERAASPSSLLGRTDVWRTVAVCALGLVAGLALAMWREQVVQSKGAAAQDSLTTNVAPDSTNLVLTWKSKLGSVSSAKVEILDGDAVLNFDLTAGFEQHGIFVFPHETGNVQAILTVTTPQGSVTRRAGYTNSAETIAHARIVEAVQHEREVKIQAKEQNGSLDASNRRLSAMLAYLKESRRKK